MTFRMNLISPIHRFFSSFLLLIPTLFLLLSGCEQKQQNYSDFEAPTRNASDNDPRWKDTLFTNAMENLNQLEDHEGGETGERVTGRLNEWIKTVSQPKQWVPDEMTPDWLLDVQDKLPQFSAAATACQNARQDLAEIHGKIQRFQFLQNQLQEIEKLSQKLGGPENLPDSVITKAGEMGDEAQKLMQTLQTLKTPKSLDEAVQKLQSLVSLFQGDPEQSILVDEENATALTAVANMLNNIIQHGPNALDDENWNYFLRTLDVLGGWLNGLTSSLELSDSAFPTKDISYLKETVWFRDAARWAQGTNADDLKKIEALFDWTVKNLALESPLGLQMTSLKTNQPSPLLTPLPAWQILLTGRATPEERAWIFSKLAAQQGLDVVLVRVPCQARATTTPSEKVTSKTINNIDKNETANNIDKNETASLANKTPADIPAELPQVETPPAEVVANDSADATEKKDADGNNQPESTADPEAAKTLPGLDAIPELQQPEKILAAWVADDKIYLFDPELGVPIPAINGISLPPQPHQPSQKTTAGQETTAGQGTASEIAPENGSLVIQPATWQDALEHSDIFTQLNYTVKKDNKILEKPYPIQSADLANAEFLIPVEPESLSKRMWILQGRLTGDDAMALVGSPSTLAERLKKLVPNHSVALWDRPFESVSVCPLRFSAQSVLLYSILTTSLDHKAPLMRGRILYLKGNLTASLEGDESAVSWFQRARLSDDQMDRLNITDQAQLFRGVRLFATYWLGLLSDAHNRHEAAADYFLQASQEGQDPVWIVPALYNMGRVEEEMGNIDKAIELYRKADCLDVFTSVNGLRANWLETLNKKPK